MRDRSSTRPCPPRPLLRWRETTDRPGPRSHTGLGAHAVGRVETDRAGPVAGPGRWLDRLTDRQRSGSQRSGRTGDDPQVGAAAGRAGAARRPGIRRRLTDRRRPGRLADDLGQRLQVVRGRISPGVTLDPHHRPPQWHRQSVRVRSAQVVGVGLHKRRQRTQHRRRIGVGVGQGGNGSRRTCRTRTPPRLHVPDGRPRSGRGPQPPAVSRGPTVWSHHRLTLSHGSR